MRDLNEGLADAVRIAVETEFDGNESLRGLVNDVISDETDVEHLITFLDESSSGLHRRFASALRDAFERVLRKRLSDIETEQGRVPDDLYFVLLDMHGIENFPELLTGFLTLNYDTYLESAIERTGTRSCDRGIALGKSEAPTKAIRTLKLHGSFDWNETSPISMGHDPHTLWIPPGIQKIKQRYPFNLLWGLAREMLNCDILRVVGCRLGPNDWDLISLLFATRHTNTSQQPYRIELIDAPGHARELQRTYPYLDIQSILEIEPIGRQLVAEFSGRSPTSYRSLTADEQDAVVNKAGRGENWFRLWLKHKAEATLRDFGSVSTNTGAFETFLEAY